MIAIGDYRTVEFLRKEEVKTRLKTLNKNIIHALDKIDLKELKEDELAFLKDLRSFYTTDGFCFFSLRPENIIGDLNACPTSRLKDSIFDALNYKSRRTDLLPEYFHHLGIKACIYCNSQSALTFEKEDGEFKSLLQADHSHPKDKYPYLAVSLFNLYPCCSSCNLHKSSNEIVFDLYSNEKHESRIRFSLTDESLIRFTVERDYRKIQFQVEGDKNFIAKFHLNEIYDAHQDIAEELVVKALAYNSAYKNELKKLGITDEDIKRHLVGNYTNDHEMFKRPLSKFMADIARDLKMI
ncbi:hypothetical protein [Flavobacterium sp. YO12]|uniref:hypothetical protein n=1 Tax=Flavobacterium sp. YO12 TaxID=1920029 RepID=UPI00100B0208|nr:hypothetical protein [Flavobacterium sp. YO12]RXM43914.1 hypothetical protein BOW55_18390 [Flavobacterium sp. YO12]